MKYPTRSCLPRAMALGLAALIWQGPAPALQETPPAEAAPAPIAPPDRPAVTLVQITEMFRSGTPTPALLNVVNSHRGSFDATLDDMIRMHRMGMPPELLRAIALKTGAAGGTTAASDQERLRQMQEQIAREEAQAEAELAAMDAQLKEEGIEIPDAPEPLAEKKVLKMARAEQPGPDAVSREVLGKGLKKLPELNDLLDYRAEGISAEVIRAMGAAGLSGGSVPPFGPSAPRAAAPRPTTTAPPAPAAGPAAAATGAASASSTSSTSSIQATQAPPSVVKEEEEEEMEPAAQAAAAAADSAKRPRDVPTPQADDRVWIASVPRGAQVYVAPAGIRREEWSERDYRVGVTPLALQIPPGEYIVVIQKPRDAFDAALLPAWRTKHDSPDTRSVLDNADLMINASRCCLPESFTGEVDIRPVFKDRPEMLIGDMFDGLPPYLLDGETYQILRVRKASVESVMKAYPLRKSPGGSRMLVASFVPTLTEPLDPNGVAGLPAGTPYAELLHAATLDYLTDTKQLPEIASTLRVDPARLSSAVSMLGRTGKAIIAQKIDGGMRTLTLALDDYGRLRVNDQQTRPVDPFAPEPEETAASRRKKKKPAIPPPPPSLPVMSRAVVPGLGMPRLVLDNKSARGQGLIFSDGQFYYVPGKTKREFLIEPGSFHVRLIAPEGAQSGPAPEGQLHFAFQARYSLTL